MNEIVNNKVNLCDSCSQVYPDCTSRPENVYFGDGIGNDNICACSEYRPKTCGDGDTISRAAAINVLGDMVMNWTDSEYELGQLNQWKADRKAIIDLPSAQPDIIRCRNCKFASGDSRICMKFGHSPIGELDFCAWAERRTDGVDS